MGRPSLPSHKQSFVNPALEARERLSGSCWNAERWSHCPGTSPACARLAGRSCGRQNQEMNDFDALPRSEFGFPGALRDRLVSEIHDGSKTSTTSAAVEYRIEDEPFPQIGALQVVVDSAEKPVAVIEITDVQQVRLAVVPWEHARDEGEGYSSVAEWRAGHASQQNDHTLSGG